jgi:hypothetical protein
MEGDEAMAIPVLLPTEISVSSNVSVVSLSA